ncbi:MAG: hypothetical protein K0R12_1410, partial [Gammaproteobacteria bacterium]|nr:hypothetical protein [Gammaproteobacteria bacterium]
DNKNKEGMTGLLWAASRGYTQAIPCLLRNGAQIIERDRAGMTALLWAASNGHAETIHCLLEQGATFTEKDQRGRTAIFCAKQKAHVQLAAHLQELKEREDLKRLLVESQQRAEEHKNFSVRQAELEQELAIIFEKQEVELAQFLNTIWFELTHLLSMQTSCPDILNAIDLKFPSQLVDVAEPPKGFFSGFFSSSKPVKYKALSAQIEIVKSTAKTCQTSNKLLSDSLLNFASLCQQYKERLDSAKTEEEKAMLQAVPSIAAGEDMAPLVFQGEAADKLTQLGKKENEFGTSTVHPIGQVHFKKNPYAPGIEFMVSSLANLLAGQGTTPTKLIKIIDRHGMQHVYLASKTVVGKELHKVLQHHPDAISQVRLDNFSAMILLSLLTNPQDGKADNYMVEFKADSEGRLISLDILGIDNDIAFVDEEISRKINPHHNGKGYFVNVKNVLYFFPQMAEPISDHFREALLKRVPELLMIDWLGGLVEKNKQYEALLNERVFSHLEFSGNEKVRGIQLPIKLQPGMATKIYQKLVRTFQLLRENPGLTHQQLFEGLQPILAQHYKKVSQQHPDDILGATAYLYQEALEDEKEIEAFREEIAKGNLCAMTNVVLTTIQEHDFEKKRTQDLRATVIEILRAFDWIQFTGSSAILVLEQLNELKSRCFGQHPSLLHIAVEYKLFNLLLFLLKNRLVDVHERNEGGYTAMHIAASLGNVSLLKMLQDHGADLNSLDKLGEKPVHKASRRQQHEAQHWLEQASQQPMAPVIWALRAQQVFSPTLPSVFSLIDITQEGPKKVLLLDVDNTVINSQGELNLSLLAALKQQPVDKISGIIIPINCYPMSEKSRKLCWLIPL